MRKSLHIVIAALLVFTALPVLAVQANDDAVMLGLSVPTTTTAYYEGLINGATAVADEMEIELVVVSADNDPATELSNVESLVEQGADAILFSPTDFEASADAILVANEAEIPLFLVGSDVTPDAAIDVVSLITADESVGGVVAGTMICDDLAGSGSILALVGSADDPVLAMRQQGFDTYVADKCPKVETTALSVADMARDDIVAAVSEALADGLYDGVVAYDDITILAALQAAVDAGVRGLTFVGFDASEDAIVAVNQGSLQAVITPNTLLMGGVSVQASAAYLAGDGIKSLIVVDQIAVTIETATTFRDPGRGGAYRFGGGDGDQEFDAGFEDGGRGGAYRDGGRGGSYRDGDDSGGSFD